MGVLRGKIVLFIMCLLLSMPVYAEDAGSAPSSSGASVQNDFSEYMNTLQGQIQKNWNPPDFLEKDGHATIMFSINRCGDIISTQIVESSGDEVFDESAMEALRKASPFNHFPANTSRGSLTIKYSFDTSIVKTDNMQEYVKNADKYYNINNHQTALNYINRAIDEVEGDSRSYFLYGKRSKIKRALGDVDGANADMDESKRLKAKYDQKRINASKLIAEMEQTPYSYFYLAHSYEIAGDYEHAIEAIDKAIALTELNNQYKRYRQELTQKSSL